MFDGKPGKTATAAALSACFNLVFLESEHTELVGGADEPLYLPATETGAASRIIFREDYSASALHEVAHWCIAGVQRRQKVDYGYWYAADGRNPRQQKQFERVEIEPQALEWILARAAGLRFRVSADNLDGEPIDLFAFRLGVWQRVQQLCRTGLGGRAERFRQALAAEFGGPDQLSAEHYSLAELC